jgi:hypothetical protein
MLASPPVEALAMQALYALCAGGARTLMGDGPGHATTTPVPPP